VRKLVVFLVLVAVCVPFTFGKVTLTIWTLFGGVEGNIITDMFNRFNKEHPDVEVQGEIITWAEFYDKLLTAILAGDPPDIAVMHLSILPDFSHRNVLLPLNDLVPSELLEEYPPAIIQKAYYHGKLYAIPFDSHPMVLYYNKKVLKEAGLVGKDGNVLLPRSWDELINYAKQVKEKLGMENPLTFAGGGERLFLGFYTQLGGKFYDAEKEKILFNPEIAARAYEILKKPFDEGVITGILDYSTAQSFFRNDQSAFHIDGVWAIASLSQEKELDYGVTLIPPIEVGTPPYVWEDSHTWVVPKKNHSKEELKAIGTFLEWFVKHSSSWTQIGVLPVIKSVQNSPEFLNLPHRKEYARVIDYVVPAPSIRGWIEIRTKMWELGQAVMLGETTPSQAAKELESAIKEATAE